MKNKYQKPAIYLTPEHTEGIYLASGAAGAAGSVTATYMGVWDRWAGGGKGLVAVNWNNVAGNVALTLSFNTPGRGCRILCVYFYFRQFRDCQL